MGADGKTCISCAPDEYNPSSTKSKTACRPKVPLYSCPPGTHYSRGTSRVRNDWRCTACPQGTFRSPEEKVKFFSCGAGSCAKAPCAEEDQVAIYTCATDANGKTLDPCQEQQMTLSDFAAANKTSVCTNMLQDPTYVNVLCAGDSQPRRVPTCCRANSKPPTPVPRVHVCVLKVLSMHQCHRYYASYTIVGTDDTKANAACRTHCATEPSCKASVFVRGVVEPAPRRTRRNWFAQPSGVVQPITTPRPPVFPPVGTCYLHQPSFKVANNNNLNVSLADNTNANSNTTVNANANANAKTNANMVDVSRHQGLAAATWFSKVEPPTACVAKSAPIACPLGQKAVFGSSRFEDDWACAPSSHIAVTMCKQTFKSNTRSVIADLTIGMPELVAPFTRTYTVRHFLVQNPNFLFLTMLESMTIQIMLMMPQGLVEFFSFDLIS